MLNRLFSLSLALALPFLLVGCGSENPETGESFDPEDPSSKTAGPDAVPPVSEAPPRQIFWSEIKLHEAIRKKNPGYSGNGQFNIDPQGQVVAIAIDNCNVSDLSMFTGMNLQALYLQSCPVEDITPLKGMPFVELYLEKTPLKSVEALRGNTTLQKLYLSGTGVTDLSPLEGLPITELNIVETHVKDLSPLQGMPLQMLWLTGAPVEDISPLRSSPLVSLTLHRTKVRDLSPLSGTRLQRLHIGETPVTDLSPLAGLNLTRLVFDIDRIEKGIDAIKSMRSLRELGSKFEDEEKDLVHPAVFWSERAKE